MGFPLHVTAFLILFLNISFYLLLPFFPPILIIVYRLLWVNFLWNFLYSLNLDICFFFQFRKVFSYYFFKQVFCPFLSLPFSCNPGSISFSILDIVSNHLNQPQLLKFISFVLFILGDFYYAVFQLASPFLSIIEYTVDFFQFFFNLNFIYCIFYLWFYFAFSNFFFYILICSFIFLIIHQPFFYHYFELFIGWIVLLHFSAFSYYNKVCSIPSYLICFCLLILPNSLCLFL